MTPIALDVFADIACPWCFIGHRRLQAVLAGAARAGGFAVRHRAFELQPQGCRRAGARCVSTSRSASAWPEDAAERLAGVAAEAVRTGIPLRPGGDGRRAEHAPRPPRRHARARPGGSKPPRSTRCTWRTSRRGSTSRTSPSSSSASPSDRAFPTRRRWRRGWPPARAREQVAEDETIGRPDRRLGRSRSSSRDGRVVLQGAQYPRRSTHGSSRTRSATETPGISRKDRRTSSRGVRPSAAHGYRAGVAKDTEKLVRQLSLMSFLMAKRRPVTAVEIHETSRGTAAMNDHAFARRFYADRAEIESDGPQARVERPTDDFQGDLRPPARELLPAAIDFDDARAGRAAVASTCSTGSSPTPSRCAWRCSNSPGAGRARSRRTATAPRSPSAAPTRGGRECPSPVQDRNGDQQASKTITFTYYTMDATSPASARSTLPPAVPRRQLLHGRLLARALRHPHLPALAHRAARSPTPRGPSTTSRPPDDFDPRYRDARRVAIR